MGTTYCEANPGDTNRCETVSGVNATAQVDWGTGGDAFVLVPRPAGGAVTFTITPVITETKNNLRGILITFTYY